MATSGSKDFTFTRNDIINAALRKLGEFDSGEVPGGDETDDAAFALNLLVKKWVATGADIFLRQECTLFLQKGQQSYAIGPSGDNVTSSYVETKLNGALSSGATSLTVDSITGISASDNIGIKVSDGSIHWTTVSGAPAGSTVTIATGLDAAANDDAEVYAYTTKAYRPSKLHLAIRRDSANHDTDVDLIGEAEYYNLSQKTITGVTNQVYYKPSLDSGTLYVWPTGDGLTDKLVFVAHYYPDDFDSASDNAQFPVEWGDALVMNLASKLAPEYGINRMERRELKMEAMEELGEALSFDIENASVIFAREE